MKQTLPLLTAALAIASPLQGQGAFEPPDKALHSQRRANFRDAMDGGIALVAAAIENQNRIYEGFVDHSDLHDFIYLTGLEAGDAYGSALVLAPDAETYREILYTSQDPEAMVDLTGIEHVYSYELLTEHLSDAITAFSLLRTHQRGSKDLASDLSRSLRRRQEHLLQLPTVPEPGRIAARATRPGQSTSVLLARGPDEGRTDILNRLRMIHDEYSIAMLRKASDITVQAFMESAKSVREEMTTQQIAAIVNFTFEYEHAARSFRTGVVPSGPGVAQRSGGPDWPPWSPPQSRPLARE